MYICIYNYTIKYKYSNIQTRKKIQTNKQTNKTEENKTAKLGNDIGRNQLEIFLQIKQLFRSHSQFEYNSQKCFLTSRRNTRFDLEIYNFSSLGKVFQMLGKV